MILSFGATSIILSPAFPWWLVWTLTGVIGTLCLYGLVRRARGSLIRAISGLVLLALLLDPALVIEERKALTDVAFVVIDESPSQKIGDREKITADTLAAIEKQLQSFSDLEVRVIRAGARTNSGGSEGTRLFSALTQGASDVPASRVAGAIFISDGQIHDAPRDVSGLGFDAPVHVLLTGSESEGDRRLLVTEAPGFGLVGQTITITVQTDDLPGEDGATGTVELAIQHDGKDMPSITAPIGAPQQIELPIDHAGQNIFEVSVPAGPRELSLLNNKIVLSINGVRDRLRVLLVSGEPHAGERAWRNILKSDPSVDLVHFTILRPSEKQDATPITELSLIPFPVRELFELKLTEFDLVILDRYGRTLSLPSTYFENLAQYVENGGALFESSAPLTQTIFSIYDTPLARILPGIPDGTVYDRGFRPRVTDLGHRHPVTADLPGSGNGAEDPSWGRWFRQIGAQVTGGSVVMTGLDNRPLLVLNRVGKGRVAQLWSDESWLWSRGLDGGGPQAEMLRRIAHWLMKEPELEEERLSATVIDGQMEITQHSLGRAARTVTVTDPQGQTTQKTLGEISQGVASIRFPIADNGFYQIDNGEQKVFVSAGAEDPLEFSDLRANADKIRPLLDATDGNALHIPDDGVPSVRRIDKDRAAFGSDWIGLTRNGDYAVTGIRQIPLLPYWLGLAAALVALLLAWRREGR